MLANVTERLVQRRLRDCSQRRHDLVDARSLNAFLDAFRGMWASAPLIRLGGAHDGGYLIHSPIHSISPTSRANPKLYSPKVGGPERCQCGPRACL